MKAQHLLYAYLTKNDWALKENIYSRVFIPDDRLSDAEQATLAKKIRDGLGYFKDTPSEIVAERMYLTKLAFYDPNMTEKLWSESKDLKDDSSIAQNLSNSYALRGQDDKAVQVLQNLSVGKRQKIANEILPKISTTALPVADDVLPSNQNDKIEIYRVILEER